ncbi:unnamed protein product [Pedinophyceae sp. YPF-701]|nr:unnamed protein product [Pedinophyceae sp. YPF-701]
MQELNEAREAHSKGMSLYEMRRRRRDEERAAQDAQNEDEMAKKERQEQQKAARWAAKIRTQEAGEGVPAGGQSPTTLDKFLHCIREGKVVRLEDLAARFQISVEQTIAWIRDLEGAGRLTGVMDDRGKYVYVSPAECKAVAKFIMDKGRVTMEDIAKQTTAAVGLGPP